MWQKRMGAGFSDDLHVSRPERDLAVEDDEQLVLVVVAMEWWAEAARSSELHDAEGSS